MASIHIMMTKKRGFSGVSAARCGYQKRNFWRFASRGCALSAFVSVPPKMYREASVSDGISNLDGRSRPTAGIPVNALCLYQGRVEVHDG